MFGDFSKLGKIMKIATDMKEKMPEVQEKLENSEFTAEAGGGVVKATVNGKLKLVDLSIDPQVLSDGEMDAGMLEDLIKAAISKAQDEAAQAAQDAMMEITGGMDLGGLGAMFGQ
ncbi:MAG: YbaB/EbfC family nucleoid-associated protein [Phycisphaerae bacterium]